MGLFSQLTYEQVLSTYGLFKLLERLRITGHLTAHTVGNNHYAEHTLELTPPIPRDDFNPLAIYEIIKDGYDASRKRIAQEEALERIFGRLGKKLRGTD